MNRFHVAFLSGFLALAAVFGTVAASHTVSLGAAHRTSVGKTVAARATQLDRFEATLQRALARKPPALPAVPKTAPTAQVVPAAAPSAAPQRVIYQRPPPVVVVKHTHHGDDGFERHLKDGGGDG